MGLMTHRPVARALEAFAKEHLDNPRSDLFRLQQSHFADLLAIKQQEWLTPHENEGAYGMSSAGGCLLKADLKRDGVEGLAPEGYTRATWHHGHLVEVELLSMIMAIGCTVEGLQAPVRTYRADGALLHSSKVDGIITAAPPELELPVPCILSCKSTAYKLAAYTKDGQKRRGFAALPFGVMREEPSWFLQAQLEMHGTQQLVQHPDRLIGFPGNRDPIGHVLLVAMAKDVVQAYAQDSILQDSGSLTFYAELIPYQEKLAQLLCFGRETYDHRAGLPQLAGDRLKLVNLPAPGSPGGPGSKGGWSIWGGENQGATGTFNPCGACEYRLHCAKNYGGK